MKRVFRIGLQGFMLNLGLMTLVHRGASAESQLRFQVDSEVRKAGSSEKRSIKAGDTLPLSNSDVVLVEARGRIPVVIIPTDTARGTLVDLNQPEVDQWPTSQVQAVLDRDLSVILDRVLQVQELLSQKKTDEALREVDRLKAEFPGVAHFDFLRASALLLKGSRDEAVESLKRALLVHPNHVRGQELLKALEGRSP